MEPTNNNNSEFPAPDLNQPYKQPKPMASLDNVSPSPPKPSFSPTPIVTTEVVQPPKPAEEVPVESAVTPEPTPIAKVKKPRHGLKMGIALVAAIVILFGASAAAFFGVVEPNEPANVLKQSILNTLQQTQISYNGEIVNNSSNSSKPDVKITVSGQADTVAKTENLVLGVSVLGQSIKLHFIYIDQDLYINAGDLNALANIVGSINPSYAALASSISKEVSNQWIEIDSTLLNQSNINCYINNVSSLNKTDVTLMQNAYKTANFATISTTKPTTVNGQGAIEYTVLINDNKGATFLNNLSNLSVVKSVNSCNNSADDTQPINLRGDSKTTTLNVWVYKSDKRIAQIYWEPSQSLISSAHSSGHILLTFSYGPVSTLAPQRSESIEGLYAKLAQSLGSKNTQPSATNIQNLLNSITSGGTL